MKTVIEKIRKLDAKSGPFDHVILLGEIEEAIKHADLNDLPSMIILSSTEEAENTLVENVTVLRRFGIYKSPCNINIGFLGLDDDDLELNKSAIVEKFDAMRTSVDVLICRQWSETIADRQKNTLGHEVVDQVTKIVRPKYHITYDDTERFFELEPFMWSDGKTFTRFINIATFQSGSKWAYAFNMDTSSPSCANVKPKNLIPNPYLTAENSKHLHGRSESDENASRKKKKIVLPTNCHFCFANPKVEDHMFISISHHAYLTVAKGPLSVAKGEMNFSGHCLIIPIEHIPKLKVADTYVNESELISDLNSYEHSIVKMNYRKFDMSTVVFEIHSEKSIHFHKQLIPVPKYLIMNFSQALDRQCHLNNEKYTSNGKLNFKNFNSTKDKAYLDIVTDPKHNYLQFTVYETSEAEPEVYLALFEPNDRIDLQFGRRVLAFLLRLPKRVNWNSPICEQSKEQEEKEVAKFQKSYEEFDITK